MTWAMYDQLRDACDQLAGRRDVRVVVLRGAGEKAFVAGTDIGQFREFDTAADGLAYEERIEGIVQRLEQLPMPTVAALDGYVVGGGLTLAAVCDLRICTPQVRFGLPIARTVGNCLSMATYARLVALLGPARTKKLIIGGSFVEAQEALASGLATEVIERDRFDKRIEELCDQLSHQAPLTMWATKESIRRLSLARVPENTDIIERVYGSEDFAEGVSAFVGKRLPDWKAR
jgi:enoyl-CoA hydratase/carnithine racemase